MAETISSSAVKTGGNGVIEKMLADLPGGAELDTSAVTTEYDANDGYVPEGTPIYKSGTDYLPLLAADLVANGPAVVGFLFQEVHKDQAYASICIRGVVNEDKLPFAVDAALKAAVPGISFVKYT